MENKVTSLRMERQFLTLKANETEYLLLYRDCQPGLSVYWNGFGDPPSLTHRAQFDDIEFNRERQRKRQLIKGRFVGGNLGWIEPEDLEIFAAAFLKSLNRPTPHHLALLKLIEEQPITIRQIKEETGMLVKEITPLLHRLQEAFLIYEDQYDGEWDRGWHRFEEMFPQVSLTKYSRIEALTILLKRFAYRSVSFDIPMARSFYKFSEKELKTALTQMVQDKTLVETDLGFILTEDLDLLKTFNQRPVKSVFVLHRNDFLVKSNEHWLKDKYSHSYPDTLYYILIDGCFCGAVTGKFRYTPDIEDVILDLPENLALSYKNEILKGIRYLGGAENPIKRYLGIPL